MKVCVLLQKTSIVAETRAKATKRPVRTRAVEPITSSFESASEGPDEDDEFRPMRGRLAKGQQRKISRTLKYSGTEMIRKRDDPLAAMARTTGPNEEPHICTRCGNKAVGLDHFYQFHNGLLAAEQETFDPAAKRKVRSKYSEIERWIDCLIKGLIN